MILVPTVVKSTGTTLTLKLLWHDEPEALTEAETVPRFLANQQLELRTFRYLLRRLMMAAAEAADSLKRTLHPSFLFKALFLPFEELDRRQVSPFSYQRRPPHCSGVKEHSHFYAIIIAKVSAAVLQ